MALALVFVALAAGTVGAVIDGARRRRARTRRIFTGNRRPGEP